MLEPMFWLTATTLVGALAVFSVPITGAWVWVAWAVAMAVFAACCCCCCSAFLTAPGPSSWAREKEDFPPGGAKRRVDERSTDQCRI